MENQTSVIIEALRCRRDHYDRLLDSQDYWNTLAAENYPMGVTPPGFTTSSHKTFIELRRIKLALLNAAIAGFIRREPEFAEYKAKKSAEIPVKRKARRIR